MQDGVREANGRDDGKKKKGKSKKRTENKKQLAASSDADSDPDQTTLDRPRAVEPMPCHLDLVYMALPVPLLFFNLLFVVG